MSTAPLSAFIPKQPQGHYLGSLKPQLKLKETKADLKQYTQKLETALAALKRKRDELLKDCDRLNKEYTKEVRKAEKRREIITQVRTLVTTMVTQNKLCEKCRGSSELLQI